ncbi:MAG: oligosaccharide flippase family protein, partial [Clostridia bacterium]|nr:oligosaccharide flippase family protein [Clostridia bacterium]
MTEIKNIFKTVAMVTAFSCAERFIGFLYRIYLSRSLGAEGLGLYQISLSVLGLFMTITSSGIPITVSRMIAKNKNSALVKKDAAAVTSGILLTLAVSIPITFLVVIKSPLVSFLFSDERCMTVLCIMIPGLAFTSVYAVIRGFFWGNSEFLTYSVIELAEEGVMAIVGIILVNGAIETFDGVQKASYAVLISYLFSFSASAIVFFLKGGRLSAPKDSFLPLLYSSAPITAMRTSTSLINTLVSVLLPARLIYYGATSSAAVAEFGKVFGMAIPMIFMPSTLIGSLAVVLVPELSDNYYSGKALTLKNNIEKAVKFSCFVACMIIPAFFAVGEELGSFLYSDPSAGAYITKSAAIMLPLSLSIISTSILNSLGKEKLTLVSFLIGASVMLLCIYFLPSVIGVNSLIAGMFLSFSISSA